MSMKSKLMFDRNEVSELVVDDNGCNTIDANTNSFYNFATKEV